MHRNKRFEELRVASRDLQPLEIREMMLQLSRDPRFAAVFAWLEAYREEWAKTVSSQKLAADHGKLAHTAGCLHALLVLEGSLHGILQAVNSQGPTPGS